MQLLSLVVAAYGAVVATHVAYLTYRRQRHRIRMWCMLEMLSGPAEVAIHVVNSGTREITIRDGWIRFSDGSGRVGFMWPNLPAKLSDGDEIKLGIPLDRFPMDSPMKFEVEDTTGRTHQIEFSDEFLRQMQLLSDYLASDECTAPRSCSALLGAPTTS